MRILSIETSCDETAMAVVEASGSFDNPQFSIKNEIVASQIDVHKEFGGVVPTLAKREHIKNLPILFKNIFSDDKITIDGIDLIAVTVGPGLEPALWTGINFAKEISEKYNKKLIGVNHLHGHLYSFLLDGINIKLENIFPSIVLLVSGGHTELILMNGLNEYKKLGETRDDAVGESFDKVARLLGLQYPGGPEIEKLAKDGDEKSINFPMPMINTNDYDFSYSGLKTAVLYYLRKLGSEANNFNPTKKEKEKLFDIGKVGNLRADIAASFQYSALEVLVRKTIKAVNEFEAKSVVIGGGVSANKKLKEMIMASLNDLDGNIKLFVPPLKYCMDNATMIAIAGYFYYLNNFSYPLLADGRMDVE